jgi:hypothetical protein
VTQYAKRESGVEPGEHIWRVESETLVWTRPSGETVTLLWRDVISLRIAFAATRWKPRRHLFELGTRQGLCFALDNCHFVGLGRFEDRSSTFTPFARACIAKVAVAAPRAVGRIGARPAVYLSQLAFAGLAFALLLLVLVALPTPIGVLVVIKLMLILASLPILIHWAIRSRPRRTEISPDGMGAALPRIDDAT